MNKKFLVILILGIVFMGGSVFAEKTTFFFFDGTRDSIKAEYDKNGFVYSDGFKHPKHRKSDANNPWGLRYVEERKQAVIIEEPQVSETGEEEVTFRYKVFDDLAIIEEANPEFIIKSGSSYCVVIKNSYTFDKGKEKGKEIKKGIYCNYYPLIFGENNEFYYKYKDSLKFQDLSFPLRTGTVSVVWDGNTYNIYHVNQRTYKGEKKIDVDPTTIRTNFKKVGNYIVSVSDFVYKNEPISNYDIYKLGSAGSIEKTYGCAYKPIGEVDFGATTNSHSFCDGLSADIEQTIILENFKINELIPSIPNKNKDNYYIYKNPNGVEELKLYDGMTVYYYDANSNKFKSHPTSHDADYYVRLETIGEEKIITEKTTLGDIKKYRIGEDKVVELFEVNGNPYSGNSEGSSDSESQQKTRTETIDPNKSFNEILSKYDALTISKPSSSKLDYSKVDGQWKFGVFDKTQKEMVNILKEAKDNDWLIEGHILPEPTTPRPRFNEGLKNKVIEKINDKLKDGPHPVFLTYNTLYENARVYVEYEDGTSQVFTSPQLQQGSDITETLENLQAGQCSLKMRLTAPNVDLNPDNFESYGGANDNLSVNLPSDEILEKKFYVAEVRGEDGEEMDYEIVTPKTSHIYCVEEDQNKVQIPIVIVPRLNVEKFYPDGHYSKPEIINEFSFSYSLENRNNDFFTSDFKILDYGPTTSPEVSTYYAYLEISNYALPEGRDKEEITLNAFYEDQQEQVKFHIARCDAETAFTQKWKNFLNEIRNDGSTSRESTVQTPIPSGGNNDELSDD